MIRIPRLVIAGATSGVGKTTITFGLAAALRARGLRVQPFKCGPDYIDPSYHSLAAGVPCRNLESWMVNGDAMLELFARACQGSDLALIEGVMGLYDGRSGQDEAGSTAQIAKRLDAPVVLILDVAGTARAAGAMALGYKVFDEGVKLAGFILNRVGSPTHFRWASESIEAATGLPVLGYLPKNEQLLLPERHLGLVPSVENTEAAEKADAVRRQIEQTIDVEAVLGLAKGAKPLYASVGNHLFPAEDQVPRIRMAVARDKAFSFYYQDNLDLLAAWGTMIVSTSPLEDPELPEVDGFYVGGGFPEMYASELSANSSFRESIVRAAQAGMPIYGECGGLMYLGKGITDFEGREHEMVGIVPGWSTMKRKRLTLGYVTLRVLGDNILARNAEVLRGHEFHWSERDESVGPAAYRFAESEREEGFASGNLLASYVHLHFGSSISLVKRFIDSCEDWKRGL